MRIIYGDILPALCFLVFMSIISGCESAPKATVSGTVEAPDGVVASLQKTPGFWGTTYVNLKHAIIPPAYAAVSGLIPVPDAAIFLVEIDHNGDTIQIIEETVTGPSGTYSFFADVVPGANIVVLVEGATTTMRAMVNADSVDVTPVSEFVVQTILTEATVLFDGNNNPLSLFTAEEITVIQNVANSFDLDASGSDLEAVLNALSALSNGELKEITEAFAGEGLELDESIGAFNTALFGVNLFAEYIPIGEDPYSNNTREVELNYMTASANLDSAGQFSLSGLNERAVLLRETSGEWGDGSRVNELTVLELASGNEPGIAGELMVAPNGMALGQLEGSLLSGAMTPSGDFMALLTSGEYEGGGNSTGDHARSLLIALRQGNGGLSGNYNLVGLGASLQKIVANDFRETRECAVGAAIIPFDFEEMATEGGHNAEMMYLHEWLYPGAPSDSTVELITEMKPEGNGDPFNYTVNGLGQLVFTYGNVSGGGAVSANGEVVVLYDFEEEADEWGNGLFGIGIKEATGLGEGILNGTYNLLAFAFLFETEYTGFILDGDPSINDRTIFLTKTRGTISFDGNDAAAFGTLNTDLVGLKESSGSYMVTGEEDIDFIPIDPTVSFPQDAGSETGIPEGTYDVISTGEVTIVIDGDVFNGYTTSNGELVVLMNASEFDNGEFKESDRTLIILTKQP